MEMTWWFDGIKAFDPTILFRKEKSNEKLQMEIGSLPEEILEKIFSFASPYR